MSELSLEHFNLQGDGNVDDISRSKTERMESVRNYSPLSPTEHVVHTDTLLPLLTAPG